MPEIKARVLIVDDERAIRRFLHLALEAQGYIISEAECGQAAIENVISHKPDILILDLGLPDIDGIEVVRTLRQWTNIPIIILSVRGAETDKIDALNAGADDYLTKPFSMGELVARVGAALRRAESPVNSPVFVSGTLKVDLVRRLVTVEDRDVQLTRTEYELLRLLVVHAGKVLTQNQLLREVWGQAYIDAIHILHVNISTLRHKIERELGNPKIIVTEPGVGYRLKTEQ
jgi:two-component system KDP operon response regulator KdpE